MYSLSEVYICICVISKDYYSTRPYLDQVEAKLTGWKQPKDDGLVHKHYKSCGKCNCTFGAIYNGTKSPKQNSNLHVCSTK